MTPPSDRSTVPQMISYPKSGKTWLRYAFKIAGVQCLTTHAGYGSNTKSKNFGRTFSGLSNLPTVNRGILLIRDPIDTAVSLYFQIQLRDMPDTGLVRTARLVLGRRIPPKDLVTFLRHPGFGVKRVCQFNRAWIDHVGSDSRFIIVKYELIRRSPDVEYKRILDHIAPGRGFDIEKIVRETSFEVMRKVEESTNDQSLMLGAKGKDDQSRKVRRGKIKGYVDYLDATQRSEFEKIRDEFNLTESA
ncbi:sulfotransferase domain-containing protein [Devosia sp.]|uniref:sulfotransferase domain-containing protein n=1 Tax=Devosia sp. TaxID=1871048 RepID=UPI003BAB87DF